MNTYPTLQGELKNDYSDMESNNINIKAEMRLGFIRKVYGILSAQLLLTTIFSGIACISEAVKSFLLDHFGITLLKNKKTKKLCKISQGVCCLIVLC